MLDREIIWLISNNKPKSGFSREKSEEERVMLTGPLGRYARPK